MGNQMARVYKFLPRKWAFDDIEKRHIKISRVCDLNDPFDLSPFDLSDGDSETHLFVHEKFFSTVAEVYCVSRSSGRIRCCGRTTLTSTREFVSVSICRLYGMLHT